MPGLVPGIHGDALSMCFVPASRNAKPLLMLPDDFVQLPAASSAPMDCRNKSGNDGFE